MTALQEAARKALACLELYDHEDLASCEARHELRIALAQQEEPVAYIDKRGRLLSYKDKPIPVDTLVYEAAAQALPAEELTDRLVAISSAVADSDDREAQAMLSETLQLLAAARSQPEDGCAPNHMCNGHRVHIPTGECCNKCGATSW